MKKVKGNKLLTTYYFQKVTNSVIKWTGIITSYCLDQIKNSN